MKQILNKKLFFVVVVILIIIGLLFVGFKKNIQNINKPMSSDASLLLDALPPENPYTPANCPTVPHSKSFDALKTFQNYFDGLRSDLKSNNSKNVQEDWDVLSGDVGCNQDWKYKFEKTLKSLKLIN